MLTSGTASCAEVCASLVSDTVTVWMDKRSVVRHISVPAAEACLANDWSILQEAVVRWFLNGAAEGPGFHFWMTTVGSLCNIVEVIILLAGLLKALTYNIMIL